MTSVTTTNPGSAGDPEPADRRAEPAEPAEAAALADADEPAVAGPVGGPVRVAWREGTLTRIKELEWLCVWVTESEVSQPNAVVFGLSVQSHLTAAKQAALAADLEPRPRFPIFWNASLRERAISNLDAAEANLLNFAPPKYVLGQIPSLLKHVQCHLTRTDPRRLEFERIAQRLGIKDPDHPLVGGKEERYADRITRVEQERGQIVAAMRAASSAALREQVRVRSFRNVLVVTTVLMTMLAVGVAVLGFLSPTTVPLCFAPQAAGEAMVVCPTGQSTPFPVSPEPAGQAQTAGSTMTDVDDAIRSTATPLDLLVVELLGLTAASVSAAMAIRRIRGSSERYGLPVALAALKLPTGALTAFLGLLLMRGQFVPGLTALDTSAQILAWAVVFGYAQQLFTRLVDQQGQTVLDSVRGADNPPPT